MKRPYIIVALGLALSMVLNDFSMAQEGKTSGGRIVICIVQLEHADAENLASTLKPFLSPEGTLLPYKATNSLIIKDREHVVNMLAEVIKGRPCTTICQSPNHEFRSGRKVFYLDN